MHSYVYIMQSAKHRYFHLFRGNLWCAQIFSALHHYLMCHFCMLAYCTYCTRSRNVTTQRIGLLFFSSSLTLQPSISLSHSRSPDCSMFHWLHSVHYLYDVMHNKYSRCIYVYRATLTASMASFNASACYSFGWNMNNIVNSIDMITKSSNWTRFQLECIACKPCVNKR